MSHENLSRRAMMRGVATLAVVPAAATLANAAPAQDAPPVAAPVEVAATPTDPDPMIAAIEDHRRFGRKMFSLYRQLNDAEERVRVEEPRLSTLIAWRTHTAIGHSEIEQFRDRLLAEPRANRRKIEAEYQKAKADERDAIRMERDWYKRNGLAALKAETDRASKAYDKAGTALTRIRPTTIAGAGALIGYVGYTAHELAGECVWHAPAVANAARALLAMPDEALPPFAEQAPDLDLLNATHNMHNADCSLDLLHKKYGDDADSRDDYHRIDAERDEALEILATKRSRSSNGMIAKAEALNDSQLHEDYERHGTVAASLAADVLRHFGARLA